MAAGLGFKTFTTGEVLTAADTNGYLMQGVLVFASSAARSAAITSPQEGQYSYLKDTDSTEYYDGAAWIAAPIGDITGVTAGTGISGGGTSGTVTVTNSMATTITTKGDLVPGTGSGTFARLAVGNNGESLVADSSTSTGLRYTGNYAAGKNAVINGAMYWSQRGTTFTNPASSSYTLDRWLTAYDGSGGTRVISQQAFTPGTAPVAGYEANYYLRINQSVAPTSNTYVDIRQRLENVTTFAGQTVTLSFWAKANANRTLTVLADQDFGSGGSSRVYNALAFQNLTVTTSWQRFTYTGTVASISGKTIGTSSYVDLTFRTDATGGTFTMDIWGVQLEAGSVATAFQTATGTIQGELAACQRYYQRKTSAGNGTLFGMGQAVSTTGGYYSIPIPVSFRVAPSVSHSGANGWTSTTGSAGGTIAAFQMSADSVTLQITGGAGLVAGNASGLAGNSGSAYLELSAEL